MPRTTKTNSKAQDHKHCPQCDKDLALDAFGNDRTTKDKKYRICKACDKINQTTWRAKQKELIEAAKAQIEAQAPAVKKAPRVTRRRTVKKQVAA